MNSLKQLIAQIERRLVSEALLHQPFHSLCEPATDLMGTVKLFRWAESNFSGGQSQILSRKFLMFFFCFFFLKTPQVFTTLSWADTYEIFLIILKTSAIFFSI